MRFSFIAILAAALFTGPMGCSGGGGSNDPSTAVDLGTPAPDAASADATAPAPDAALPPPDATPPLPLPTCACDDAETCAGCMARIGECCYGDREVFGQVAALARTCEADPGCRICCRECERMTCQDLAATGSCPLGSMPAETAPTP